LWSVIHDKDSFEVINKVRLQESWYKWRGKVIRVTSHRTEILSVDETPFSHIPFADLTQGGKSISA
jgi:hypothetical protein